MPDTMQKSLLRDALGTSELLASRYAYNASGNAEYIGMAEPGITDDVAQWLIRKIVYDAQQRPIAILFADGRCSFSSVWNDRASYTYA
ncbi:MAG: hypothetical protein HQL79_07440 [Magnetococcales bacterium]|nr:hypothetical protein [Magnetococcales bacterium]